MNASKSVLVGVVLLSILSAVAISQGFSVVTDGANPFALLWAAIEDLQTQIDQIELMPGPPGPTGPQGPQGEQGPPGPPGEFGAPDYDSGWVSIDPGDNHELAHGLVADESEFFVYMIGRFDARPADPLPSYVYHQGSGAYWHMIEYMPPSQRIRVSRNADDTVWQQYRLCIWVIP